MRKLICILLYFFPLISVAQNELNRYGSITGSFESNNQFYIKDNAIRAIFPQDKIGSNNYVKLDYNYKRISGGIQYEAYLPALQGYPFVINDAKLAQKYFTYNGQIVGLTAGNFYDQFGSGLVFRSWENRALGINNAMEGIRLTIKPISNFGIKFIYGKQRKNFDKSDGIIRAVDAQWQLVSNAKENDNKNLLIAAGFVSRYQQYTGPDPDFKPTVNAFSGRLNYSVNKSSLSVEYVLKSKDPHTANQQNTNRGKALLINASGTVKNIGININLRRLESMDFRTDRSADQSLSVINYLPALTRQQEYFLSNIYVYNTQALGEIGGQADVYWNVPKESFLGGRYGMNVALNISRYHALQIVSETTTNFKSKFLAVGSQLFYNDINLYIKKKFSKKWTQSVLLQHIYYNKSVVEGGNYDNICATIIVAEVVYKYTLAKVLRTELQHLSTRQDKRNWMGALVECSYAPHWSVVVSDMYNYGDAEKKVHYYNIGGSYTTGPHKLVMGFGRQRAGLVCVGGVCRLLPAATGLNVSLTSSF
jgi:Family of unknown function (DUF6029)